MRNVDMNVRNDVLTITIDLQEQGQPSASGKSRVIASTEGAVTVEGTNIKVGLNVYRPVKKG